jgi:hypothetical protein
MEHLDGRCSCREEALVGALHEVDVLLRHRLTPEAGGFEGFFWFLEPLKSHCLAVADGPD